MGLDQSKADLVYSRQYGYHEITEKGVVKVYELTSREEQESFKNLISLYRSFDVPTILPILASEKINNPDTILYGWKLTFKYLKNNLQQEIESMIARNLMYSEEQILKVVDCVLSALMGFKLKKLAHGNVNCENIFVDFYPGNEGTMMAGDQDGSGKVYAIGLPLILNFNDTELMISEKKYNKLYLSPFALLQISEGKKKLSNDQRSDVFALGLVVLRLASLCDIGQLYDYPAFKIKEEALKRKIYECRRVYSMALCNMLESMLTRKASDRPDFQELYNCFSLMTNFDQGLDNGEDNDGGGEMRMGQGSSNKKEEPVFKPLLMSTTKQKDHIPLQLFNTASKPLPPDLYVSAPELTRSFTVSRQSEQAWNKFKLRMLNKSSRSPKNIHQL